MYYSLYFPYRENIYQVLHKELANLVNVSHKEYFFIFYFCSNKFPLQKVFICFIEIYY